MCGRGKRGSSPLLRLKALPPLPRLILLPLRLVYEAHFLIIIVTRALTTLFYRNPLFQSRCESFGRDVSIEGLPFVSGHLEIHIGNSVNIGGRVAFFAGSTFEHPQLVIKDRSAVGWGTVITVNKEVIIEEDVIVSYDCRISDSDGHCREADLRAAGARPAPNDISPVRICRHAWIGNGSHIMKGVTIGEGAVVSANSVVVTNVPPYTLAMGNPAEIILRNFGLPSTARKKKKPEPASPPPQ